MEETPARPAVRRTYGSAAPRVRPSASLIFDVPALSADPRSSSPPSSSAVQTPPPLENDEALFLEGPASPPSSPLPPRTKAPFTSQPKINAVQSTLKGYFEPAPSKKRPLEPAHAVTAPFASLSTAPGTALSVKLEASKPANRSLAQTRLTHLPLLHTCKECQMSFVRGSEDEAVHQKHHARVVRGILWEGLGRGQDKGKAKAESGERGSRVLQEVEFGWERKGRGRIVLCEGSWGGLRLQEIVATVDTVLSAPALSAPILQACKVFLLVTASPPPPSTKRARPVDRTTSRTPKERIVAVVVSQGIKTAMRVLREGETVLDGAQVVDSGGGVVCDPTPLPTGLGIHRLFTVPAYRGCGLATILLDAAAQHTVYGCTFGPAKGEVAFSQPTESGRAVMERWGQGAVRVFVDDESQL